MEFADIHPLSLIIFLPVLGALIIALMPGIDGGAIKRIAAFFAFLSFALAVAGLATLWMAIVADVGATLVVILNGIRLRRM